jgi:hypothetical protein
MVSVLLDVFTWAVMTVVATTRLAVWPVTIIFGHFTCAVV